MTLVKEIVRQFRNWSGSARKKKKNRKTLPKITVINFKTSEPDVKQK